MAFDILRLHQSSLPDKIEELEQTLLPQLKETIEGTWEYSVMGIQTMNLHDPVFTRKGDLLCELALDDGEDLPV